MFVYKWNIYINLIHLIITEEDFSANFNAFISLYDFQPVKLPKIAIFKTH